MLKKIKKFLLCVISVFMLLVSSSCVAKAFEDEINVVFMYEDEFISHDTVTQFKNIKTPTLAPAYIPDGYKFFGWTPLNPNSIDPAAENFKDTYIGTGKMIHWADANPYKVNSTVIYKALMIDKADIPQVYHYVVIAWYDKVATSGLDQALMDKFEDALFAHLRSINVSEKDLESIVIRPYTGNVGTSCGKIMEDEDVDIMFGWSSVNNVTTTGGMDPASLLESVSEYYVGSHSRYLHRLTDKETAVLVFEWLKSEECRNLFK
ncbi:MAG: hypothetical protein IJZ77_00820 [Bacilli bacterium]|nr:hypothetical protein [Bacilli bacterium]